MATVFDVAAYILERCGALTAMKLQKLVYYSQAWSLVWDEAPLFNEKIEAWANGPVAPDLYAAHRGIYEVSTLTQGNPQNLTEAQKETVRAILSYYGQHTAQWLSDLTHMEEPWKNARAGIPDTVRSNAEISHASMSEYYGSLRPDA